MIFCQSRRTFRVYYLYCWLFPVMAVPSFCALGDCNFDAKIKSECGWENADGFNLKRNVYDQLIWIRTWGTTSTAGSGPDMDHTFSDPIEGYYVFCRSNGPSVTHANYVGRYVSPEFSAIPGLTRCMHFWYYMYGDDIRNLSIYIHTISSNSQGKQTDSGKLLWVKPGQQGRRWISQQVNIHNIGSKWRVVFMGAREHKRKVFGSFGNFITGDIAIDDISFTEGACPTNCAAKKWGNGCRWTCGKCQNDTNCAMDGLCEKCKPGYQQAKCLSCAKNAYNPGTGCLVCGRCLRHPQCNLKTGKCPECQTGFRQPMCQDCADFYYGPNCRSCGHCYRNKMCDKRTGNCPTDGVYTCEAGYRGAGCHDKCLTGKYGLGCAQVCGECGAGQRCRHTDGACVTCIKGFKPPLCKACQKNLYGVNCAESCGQCSAEEPTCHHVTGECIKCMPGKKLPTCKEDCDDGQYGDDCMLKCGRCVGGVPCNRTTGQCPNGCPPGLLRPLCQTECVDGYYGDCQKECGHCESGNACHKISGQCDVCQSGYKPPLCQECKIQGGCQEAKQNPKLVQSVGFILGMVFLGVAVMASVVMIVAMAKRRRKKKDHQLRFNLSMPTVRAPSTASSSHRNSVVFMPPLDHQPSAVFYTADDYPNEDASSVDLPSMAESSAIESSMIESNVVPSSYADSELTAGSNLRRSFGTSSYLSESSEASSYLPGSSVTSSGISGQGFRHGSLQERRYHL